MGELMRVAAACGALWVIGCGGRAAEPGGSPATRTSTGTNIGTSGPIATAGDEQPAQGAIELTLRRTDGTFLEVGELRGQVVVLFLFATFDPVSQMLLRPLGELTERRPDVQVIGVAAQPSARLLVDAYEHALTPPFPLTYEPRDTVQTGQSSLGEVEAVPTLLVLDSAGRIVARHMGFAQLEQIEALLPPP